MVALSLFAFMGKEPLVDYPPEEGDSAIFFLILTQCFLMAHLTISLMVCHVTRTHFSPFKSRIMIVQLSLAFLVYILHLMAADAFTAIAFRDTIFVVLSI